MISINNKEYRNLEEQVLKNKNDISSIVEGNIVLGELGIKVVGQANEEVDLPDPATYGGDYGDAFLIGYGTPYEYYIFTRPFEGQTMPQWFRLGEFPVAGPQGTQGIQGPQGIQGTEGSKWYTGYGTPTFTANNSDMYLDKTSGVIYQYTGSAWAPGINVKGPAGPQGLQGPEGPMGPQGPMGEQGPQGIPSPPVVILDELDSVDLLPDPSEVDRSAAYLIDGDLYIIVGSEDLSWMSLGVFSPSGTTVTSNGNVLSTFNADTKVNVIDSTNKVYTTEGGIPYTTNNTASTIAMRKSNGALLVSSPIAALDAVNLAHLNATLTNYVPKSTTGDVYGISENYDVTTTAVGSTIPLRTSDGQVRTADPVANTDAANKRYVDNAIPTIPKYYVHNVFIRSGNSANKAALYTTVINTSSTAMTTFTEVAACFPAVQCFCSGSYGGSGTTITAYQPVSGANFNSSSTTISVYTMASDGTMTSNYINKSDLRIYDVPLAVV